jgi:hypothetical protein
MLIARNEPVFVPEPIRPGEPREIADEESSLTKRLPPLPEAKNWKDLLKIVGDNNDLSLYNVTVADPVFEVYSHSTRLRFFHDTDESVTVNISIEVIIEAKVGE